MSTPIGTTATRGHALELPDWQPVYLTEDERADIASVLITHAEERRIGEQEDKARRLYYLAGLLVFATSPEVRAT